MAGLLLGTALTGFGLYARWTERRFIHALAPELFPQKMQGGALQAEAFRQPELLPIYGSSELYSFVGPFHASELFRSYPSGFEVSPVGRYGTLPLIILQDLAAVGPDAWGKKVAICVSPAFFRASDELQNAYYRGNFSPLHADELALSSELSFEVKQAAVQRMLEHPDTVQSDPLLAFILERLADGSPLSRALYYGAFPLGRLDDLALRLQDHWETLAYIRQRPDLSPEVPRRAERLDWPSLIAEARREAEGRAGNNPFGFDADYWRQSAETIVKQRGLNNDGSYRKSLQQEMDWGDLDLLLRGLRDLGARPLLLSVPIKGIFYDYWGVSISARKDYYRRTRAAATRYGVPLVDFEEFDGDKYFTVDERSHPSQEGWAYYDQALDAFYHGADPSPNGRVPAGDVR